MLRRLLLPLVLIAAPLTAQNSTAAQRPDTAGTIVVAHGGSAEWNGYVLEIAKQARTGGPLEVAFLMGPDAATHRFQDQVAKLERAGVSRLVVVPLLVSSHSGHYEQIRYLAGATDSLDEMMHHHLHMAGIERPASKLPLQVTKALDDATELARILADRAKAQAKDASAQALFLVGHGPNTAEEYADWMRNLRPVAAEVQRLTGFKDVRVDLVLDDAPALVRAEAVTRVRELIAMQALITGREVVVVPVLISRGRVSREKFMEDLKGLPVIYAGDPILPHPMVADWIATRVRETVR